MSLNETPNIIIMYADDLGFGDIGCYGATDIETPNLDKLAANGLKFQRGYATAATCTPSRYSLLTGRYPWRNEKARILAGDAPLIIDEDCETLPSMLKMAGYKTGIVGKWHLGMGYGDLDWNAPIKPTPLDVGFDESYIMAATNDRVPTVYIDGRTIEGLDPEDPIEVCYDADNNPFPEVPTGRDNPELLKMPFSHGHDMTIVNGVSRIGYMRGGASAVWDDETMAENFLNKASEFVLENKEEPFFLYYALHQPHVPRIPSKRFAGSTGLGRRGDCIAEMDWCIGELMNVLEENGLAENTIVIFSSDNGPVLNDGYLDQAVELNGDHRPAGSMRGGKYSMLDGGTRVPFILSWPGIVSPGESDALVCHVDFLASFAAMTGRVLSPETGPDSFDVLSALLGKTGEGRYELVTEGTRTKAVLHQDNWVFIPPYNGAPNTGATNIETGNLLENQLYNLSDDIGQACNLATDYPERVEAMSDRLTEIKQNCRTRTE